MQELSGGAPSAEAPRRIESGPASFEQPAEDVKPWQRGPTGAAAPWQKRGEDRGYDTHDAPPTGPSAAAPWARDRRGGNEGQGRGGDSYYGGGQNGYNAPPPSGPSGNPAPWAQAAPAYPAAAGYPAAGYAAPGYGNGYPPQQAMGAPPGLAAPPGLSAAGVSALLQQFAGSPPPPSSSIPPPPPGSAPPPPPPSDQPPPPPSN